MSFKAEVKTTPSEPFASNALRFATESEATAYARDLAGRWTLVLAWQVVKSPDPVNSRWSEEKGLEYLKNEEGKAA
jgi:hypothetical protein